MYMSDKEQLMKIREILQEVFPEDKIPDDIDDLKIGDLPSWDSLGNFNLILAIETELQIRFSMEQIADVDSIKKVLKVIKDNNG